MCVSFEMSEPDIAVGLVENIEARYCQGCFAASPGIDMLWTNNTCAAPICDLAEDENHPRGRFSPVNMWVGNDNVHDKINATNVTVDKSYYYKSCPTGRLFFERRRGEIFTNGGPDLTELTEWTPKPELKIKFDWDGCGLTPPDISCEEFPEQTLGFARDRIDTNGRGVMYERVFGACYPPEGF